MKKFILLFALLIAGVTLYGQTIRVTGTVTDQDDGSTLPGVTILVRGTTTGVVTDAAGRYEINTAPDAVLVFSFIGMQTQQIPVQGRTVINVVLAREIATLDEIVVVGYGTQIRSKLTGNIARVAGEDIEYLPVPSVQLALQGRAAGVFVEAVTGKVTSASRVRIRGSSSISASNEPLYVLDGVPLSMEARNIHGGDINPLAALNFNDIESIEILKDASAAAIYGSRAANGVILITTKKGREGKTRLSFNLQTGFANPSNKREFMDTQEYIDYFRHAAKNADAYEDRIYGDPPGFNNWWQGFVESRFRRYSGHAAILDADGKYIGSEANTNWQDQAFRQAGLMMADLSAQGGTPTLKYYASGSYSKQEGIVVGNGFERFSGRLNVDNQVNDWMDMGLTLSLSRTDVDQINADNAFANPIQLVALVPISPLRDKDGILSNVPVTTYYNGLRHVEYADRNMNEVRSTTNAYMDFKLFSGLNWRNELGYDVYTIKENNRYGELTNTGESTQGYAFSNYAQTQNLLGKSYLNYNNSFGGITLNAVMGTEIQYALLDRTYVEGQTFPLDDFKTLASAGEITGGTQEITEYSFLSYFARANFDYADKYLFSLSGRIDGSSRFGTNNRYGFFPAAAVGWIITNEDALKDNYNLSFLKLRASYGVTGNAGIGNFQHLGLYGVNTYNNQSGLIPTQIPNPDLGWETTAQMDIGLDFGFFNNRVSGEIDYYYKNTTDLLLNVPIPSTTGYTTMTRNVGSMENRGVEFVLNTNNLVGAFKWNTSFNIAYNKNEVTDIAGQDIIDPGGSRFMNVVMVGQPIGVFYGAEYAGVDPDNGDATWYINEKDADGNIINQGATTSRFSEANFIVLGKPNPHLMGGLTNSFSFRGVELSFTFQGVTGNMVHLSGDSYMAANGEWFDNQLRSQLDSWRPDNRTTNVPEARLGYANGVQGRNSRYLEDGSYLKLRTLTLAYEFPRSMLSRIGVERFRVYLIGSNLLTFTNYTGWDPEVSSDFVVSNIRAGIDFYSPPQPRSITFGINLGL